MVSIWFSMPCSTAPYEEAVRSPQSACITVATQKPHAPPYTSGENAMKLSRSPVRQPTTRFATQAAPTVSTVVVVCQNTAFPELVEVCRWEPSTRSCSQPSRTVAACLTVSSGRPVPKYAR